jgi:glycosyltransferase involved in cell wall biosynthesis
VILYTYRQPPEARSPVSAHENFAVVHLDIDPLLLEPYRREGWSELLQAEQNRVTALVLQNAVEHWKQNAPTARHLIVSFYASGAGFLAQMAASALRLPHIASVRGTDFELDVFRAARHSQLRVAIEAATLVITTNQEQASSLAAVFQVRQPIRTIPNALSQTSDRPLWETPPGSTIRLFSDCGFSGRKGTRLMLDAVASLLDRSLPVSLTLAGGIFFMESQSYWEEVQRSYESRYPGKFFFPGHVGHQELDRFLRSSHVYCSASLAEGSSVGRIRALTIGIPMVTTANGGMPEVAGDCRHVRLCQGGDRQAFALALEAAVSDSRAGTLRPDPVYIDRWRRHFGVEREREEWLAAIDQAFALHENQA